MTISEFESLLRRIRLPVHLGYRLGAFEIDPLEEGSSIPPAIQGDSVRVRLRIETTDARCLGWPFTLFSRDTVTGLAEKDEDEVLRELFILASRQLVHELAEWFIVTAASETDRSERKLFEFHSEAEIWLNEKLLDDLLDKEVADREMRERRDIEESLWLEEIRF